MSYEIFDEPADREPEVAALLESYAQKTEQKARDTTTTPISNSQTTSRHFRHPDGRRIPIEDIAPNQDFL